MADAELTKKAKAAGTSFGLFKAQLSREGHKIRGDVDYDSMTGLSVEAIALRDQWRRDQKALHDYAVGGGYQQELEIDEGEEFGDEAPTPPAKVPRGIGGEVVETGDGQYFRASTAAVEEGIRLLIERLDDDYKPVQNAFEEVYLESKDAWAAWDEYVLGLAVAIEHQNGRQTIGAKDFVFTVEERPGKEDEPSSFYFEVIGDSVETNGTRASEAEAWSAVDLWARNKFPTKVVDPTAIPDDVDAVEVAKAAKPKRVRPSRAKKQ